MGYNEVSFIGYVAGEPTVSASQDGETIVRLSVGSSVWTKTSPYTIWFAVTLWSGAASYAEKYIHKGDLVHVIGMLIADRVTGGPKVFKRRDGTCGAGYDVKGRLITRLQTSDRQKTAVINDFEEDDTYLF